MDMNTGAHPIADHRDDVVSFERVASSRKAETPHAAKPVATPCGAGWYHDAAIAAAEKDVIEARGNPYHH